MGWYMRYLILRLGPGIPANVRTPSSLLHSNTLLAVEGWVLFVSGVHEEAQEDDVREAFRDFGDVTNIHMNLDRKTGYVKGYALVEFQEYEVASKAKDDMNGTELLGRRILVDWGFVGQSNVDLVTGNSATKKHRKAD